MVTIVIPRLKGHKKMGKNNKISFLIMQKLGR